MLTFPFMKDVVEEKPKTAAEVVDVAPKPEEGIRKSKQWHHALVQEADDF